MHESDAQTPTPSTPFKPTVQHAASTKQGSIDVPQHWKPHPLSLASTNTVGSTADRGGRSSQSALASATTASVGPATRQPDPSTLLSLSEPTAAGNHGQGRGINSSRAVIPEVRDPFRATIEGTPSPLLHKTPLNDNDQDRGFHPGHILQNNAEGTSGEPDDTFDMWTWPQTSLETVHEPRKVPPVLPDAGAHKRELLNYIKQQLDCYGREPLLLDRYQLLGPEHRATGGTI